MSGVTVLAWVFGILWLIGWVGGGIGLMFADRVWIAIGCCVIGPLFLIYDIVKATRDD